MFVVTTVIIETKINAHKKINYMKASYGSKNLDE